MNLIIDNILSGLIYLLSTFLMFFIGKWVYQLFHKNIDIKSELVHKDNLAFAIAHTGYFVGLLLAIGSALIGPSNGLVDDLIDLYMYGFLAILLLNVSIYINSKVILSKFSVYDEIVRDQNAGTGAIEAANAIATGLILMGAVSGEGGNLLTAIAYWGIGQILLIITAKVYNYILPYDVHEHIEKDNVAVGIGFAGATIAIANLLRAALSHDFEDWTDSMMLLGVEFAIGLLFLPLARYATDKILLPGRKLTDELINQDKPNIGAGILEAFAYIGGSVLIGWCI